jgi:type IV secretory pathway ATPase VirB11/archaellum biosynthesis ATPase
MTTIHADTPQRAIEQLALLVLQAGSKLSRDDVRHYLRESVDVFVQLERRAGKAAGQPRAGGGVAGGGAGGAAEPV